MKIKMHFLKPDPGTYALILENRSTARIQIGRRREMVLMPGYFIYVGSAFGPGGLRARVLRHCRKAKSRHWHIDYLREFAAPVEVWYSFEPEHLECHWAQALLDMEGMHPVKGFGCTDCKCYSHLFRSSAFPEFSRLFNTIGGNVLYKALTTA